VAERWATGIVGPKGRRLVTYGTMGAGDPRPVGADTVHTKGEAARGLHLDGSRREVARFGTPAIDDQIHSVCWLSIMCRISR
jgi:hypothetical protein